MKPATPLIVSHYLDTDDQCGILTNDNDIFVPLVSVKYKPSLEYLCHTANLFTEYERAMVDAARALFKEIGE